MFIFQSLLKVYFLFFFFQFVKPALFGIWRAANTVRSVMYWFTKHAHYSILGKSQLITRLNYEKYNSITLSSLYVLQYNKFVRTTPLQFHPYFSITISYVLQHLQFHMYYNISISYVLHYNFICITTLQFHMYYNISISYVLHYNFICITTFQFHTYGSITISYVLQHFNFIRYGSITISYVLQHFNFIRMAALQFHMYYNISISYVW